MPKVNTESNTKSGVTRIHEFDPTAYDWEEWEVLFETYVEVEGISDEAKKRNLLITALAVQPFKTLISICRPKKPTECTYKELINKLRSNYAKVTFPSTERIKFFGYRQEGDQTLTDYANALRDRSITCEFPSDFYEEALVTAFVGGLRSDHIRKHLIQRNLETFEQTINQAKTIESILVEGSTMKTSPMEGNQLNKIDKHRKNHSNSKTNCASCGSTDHIRSKCRFRLVTCRNCNKDGHIAKVCRSKDKQNHKTTGINTLHYTIKNQVNLVKPIEMILLIDQSQVKFQLDTGSPVTIINENNWRPIKGNKLHREELQLSSFSGHPIHIKGSTIVQVQWRNTTYKLKLFVISGYHTNILGRDWIEKLQLDKQTLESIATNAIHTIDYRNQDVETILAQHDEIFKKGLGRCKIKAHLYVKPNIVPKFCKPRSLPFAYRQAVEKQLERLVSENVLEPVNISKWAAPIVVVPKPGGDVRICADLSTGVNQALDIDQYPLPKPDDLFAALNGGSKFSKLDFSEAYLQVELDDNSKELLVINTHKGLFRYNRLPFGVASAPSIFQKLMDQMLSGVEGAVCYLDDIIVTGKTQKQHLQNLQKVLQRIEDYGFRINRKKCQFLQNQVEYLGFIIDKNGIHASPSKVRAISNMPQPTNPSQLRSFLGMVNHYGKFIPKLTDKLVPFYTLLKENQKWDWNEKCKDAFCRIRKILTSPLALAHYDPELPLVMAADASNYGVGAVVYHRYPDGTERAIAHASKTLTETEKRYAQIEKEALALVYGTQKFDQYLRGRKFTLLTDHKPLITIFGSKKGVPTTSANRLQRWALRLMGYHYDIEYRSTKQFGQADGLSRLPMGPDEEFDRQDPDEIQLLATIQNEFQNELPVRASNIAQATKEDTTLAQVYEYILTEWPVTTTEELKPYTRIRNDLTTAQGCILWGLRTVIPMKYRQQLLDHLHTSHSGIGRMKSQARRYFWWPSLDKDIEQVAARCQACGENTKQPMKVPLQQWKVPDNPWQRIHIDYMGKFMGLYFLIVVDAHSKWLEVLPTTNISTMKTIELLMELFARFGLCQEIVSDNGTQFTSEEFANFCARHGIRHIRTTPGHPQSNGQAERYVETVKTAINKATKQGGKVLDILRRFLYSYRSTPHATTNLTPAELFLKRQLRTVLDLLRPSATETAAKAKQRYGKNFDKKTKERQLDIGNRVFVRDFRNQETKTKWTPGTLVKRVGTCVWDVEVDGHSWKRHENQIVKRQQFNEEPTTLLKSNDKLERLDNTDDTRVPQRPLRQRKPVQRLIEEI